MPNGLLLPCPFCGAEGRIGPDAAYYFDHAKGCWIGAQVGAMLSCVSHSCGELEQWNQRSSPELICEKLDAKPAVDVSF